MLPGRSHFIDNSMTLPISDTIFEALRQQILTGALEAGEKLRQDHIARAFDTSHVPVREALLRLQAHGLAVSEPRKGMRVTALNPVEMLEVVEMRVALETLALKHAIQNYTDADLETAETARKSCDAAEDLATWELRNRTFHRAVLAPCNMPRLLQTIDDLNLTSARHLYARLQGSWQQRADSDHYALMRAVERKETQTACDILSRHIRRSR